MAWTLFTRNWLPQWCCDQAWEILQVVKFFEKLQQPCKVSFLQCLYSNSCNRAGLTRGLKFENWLTLWQELEFSTGYVKQFSNCKTIFVDYYQICNPGCQEGRRRYRRFARNNECIGGKHHETSI